MSKTTRCRVQDAEEAYWFLHSAITQQLVLFNSPHQASGSEQAFYEFLISMELIVMINLPRVFRAVESDAQTRIACEMLSRRGRAQLLHRLQFLRSQLQT